MNGKRERQTDRESETKKARETHRQRVRDRDKDIDKEGETLTERATDRDRQTVSERKRVYRKVGEGQAGKTKRARETETERFR